LTRTIAALAAGGVLLGLLHSQPPAPPARYEATINAQAPTQPFPHFWEQMFGSGRAILSLRESYRRDLRSVREITGLRYVRFHGIFDDEVGVYSEDSQGKPVYNFSYVDQIYDGLLENSVRPYVELSFMPKALSSSQQPHAFWYKPLPNPPKSYEHWGDLISKFAQHLIARYGIEEVAQWYFEVWNEPNIDFWTGQPKQETYFTLYDAAAQAVKSVSPRLRVGGPASAQAAWVDALIAHCSNRKIPLDFVSTHVYANDTAKDVFGTEEKIPRSTMVARSARKVYDQVKASVRPDLPIIWSEYNASYANEQEVTDSAFMGPWLANNIRQCDGLQTMMSYWTFSDVFEEQGVVKTPFYGGFGLIAEDYIPKAAFNAFRLLHRLGARRIAADVPWLLATRRNDSLAIAAWNYRELGTPGQPIDIRLTIQGSNATHAQINIVDATHGSALALWRRLGEPATPSREQIRALRNAADLPAPMVRELPQAGPKTIDLHLEPDALALVEVGGPDSID
jgi:xylan 1,4-beta-xylosidase